MRGVLKSKYDILKQRAYVIIYGTNTPLGRLFDIVLLILIFISVIMVMLETVKEIDHQAHSLLVFFGMVNNHIFYVRICFTHYFQQETFTVYF